MRKPRSVVVALLAFACPLAWERAAVAQATPLPAEPPPDPPLPVEPPAPPEPPAPVAEPAREGADAKKPRAEDVAEVRVIGSKADALQKTPGSGTIISQKDLQRAQPVDTAEMLRRVPGVQVRQEFGGGNRIDISIRGLEGGRSRRVLLLEDGIPISINPYSEPDMYYAPVIERYRGIEVVKGSGNILFGPQTLAGTINFLTLAPPDVQRAAVDVDVGTYGYVRALANYGDRIGDARYVVQVLHRRGDGFRDLPFDSTDVLGKLAIPTGPDGTAMIKLGYHRDDAASDDIGLTSAMYASAPRRRALSPASHLVLDRYDVSITHEQRFTDFVKLKTLAYAYRTDRIWRRQDYTRSPSRGESYVYVAGDTSTPGGAIYFRDANTVLDRQYDVIGLEPRFEIKVKTGAVAHTIDTGGRVLHETAAYQQRTGGYAETYAGSLDFQEKHAGTAFAGYVQDKIAFRDDLVVTPGIRFEHLEFNRVVLRQLDGGTPRDVFVEGKKSINGIVPGVGMVFGSKQINVFGGLHVGFAPPRVTSSISARGVSSDVGADESINYELGTRTMPTKWSRFEMTGFLSNFSNQVIIATGPAAGEAVLTDAGATNLYGVESAGLVSFDKAFKWPTVVELGVRYTFSRATFRYGPDAGKLLPYAPQHNLNANFDVEHPSGIGGQVAFAFTGPQFTDATNTVAQDVTGLVGRLDSRQIVDATVHYRHKPSGLTFRLTAKNLFDVDYIIARRPEGIFPGAFRQIILGARWDWDGAKQKPAD
ncbi:MAG: TonB-dependent receptor [Deltaproteobacteria bacterium]|nr:TonB-dependent receptor [Deltaproteobacteria bacterium]